jgi:beta-mannosidase
MKVGDVHYWSVWWGNSPIEYYKEKVGYFNSEYGMQSLLPMSSMKLFLNEEDLDDSESPGIIYHNKMANGYRVIRRYVTEAFKPWVEKSLEDYSYLTLCT